MSTTLPKLLTDIKLPCYIRKNPVFQDSTDTTLNTTLSSKPTTTIINNKNKKTQNEKSLFDSLDLLNEEYLETYGIEELSSSRHELASSTLETSSSSSNQQDENDFIYLFKELTLNCAFARKFESKNVEDYLNTKYGCNTSIDISNDNIINNSVYDLTNIKYDDYVIPSNYEGITAAI
jgi:hypothetical protein